MNPAQFNEKETPASAVPERGPEASLKSRALRASGWVSLNYGLQQVIRLASNLVTTRLLLPEAYGLMAIVQVVMYGLEMFSDVGIVACVVQNPKGEEPDFLDTAWTMQVTRGVALTVMTCLLSWPVAWFYNEPRLMPLLMAASIAALINGLSSIFVAVQTRHLAYSRTSVMDLSAQLCAVAVTITCAFLYHSAWAMVAGGLASAILRTTLSHALLNTRRPRLMIDPAHFRKIISFGKYILPSSIAYFASQQLDRLMLGKYVDIATLGIYSVAILITGSITTLNMQFSRNVVFPAIGRVVREDATRVRGAYYRARHKLDLLFLPALGLMLGGGGHRLVEVLFDSRFVSAGWMLQLLGLRCAMRCVLEPCECCLVAIAVTRPSLVQNVTRMIWIAMGIPVGWYLGGITGLVWVAGLSEVPILVVMWPPMRRCGILDLKKEMFAALLLIAGMLMGIMGDLALPVRTLWQAGYFKH